MKILYIGYWNYSNNLTRAAIFPHLACLSQIKAVDKIIFITIERSGKQKDPVNEFQKTVWVPLHAGKCKISMIGQVVDHYRYVRKIRSIIRREEIDLVIANGTQAGSIMKHAFGGKTIPLVIEYFEPHSRYMLENNIWKRWDPRFIYLDRQEKKQRITSRCLITVSKAFNDQLRTQYGLSTKLETAPCSVDPIRFKFDKTARASYRKKIDIPEGSMTGIYTGKFGDLYWNQKAFELFRFCREYSGNKFFLIILSPQDIRIIQKKLMENGLDPDRFHVRQGNYYEVPAYLSAADFAFSLHRSIPSAMGYAPIKDGEYWASGLPVMITENIGDDSGIIEEHDAGAVITEQRETWKYGLDNISRILLEPDHRNRIHDLAVKYRSNQKIQSIYTRLLSELENTLS